MILFNDKITGWHMANVLDEDGSVRQRVAETPFVENLACQISFESNDNATPKGRERIPQERNLKVFVLRQSIPGGAAFKRGDRIRAERDGVGVYEGIIGELRIYTRGIAHVELSFEG